MSITATVRGPVRVAAWLVAVAALIALPLGDQAAAASRTVRVGVYQNEPKVFTPASRGGKPAGIFIDLLESVALDEDWDLVYVSGTWEEGLQGLKEGRIDLMPDVAYSAARDREYDFHKTPVVDSWSYVYAGKDLKVDRLDQLDGKSVAVLRGSIQETVFKQMVSGFGYDVRIVSVDSLKQAFSLTSGGMVDAAIANYLFGDYFYRRYGLTKTPIVFNSVPLYYATAKGHNHDLLDAIDRHLQEWIGRPESEYYKTLVRYTSKTPQPGLPPYVGWVIGGISGMLILATGVILLLQWQVGAKTRSLVTANRDLDLAYTATIKGWSRALDLRDRETEGHTVRVADMAVNLARSMGMDEPGLQEVYRGALLHDIGKMGIPDSVLFKPGALTEDEWVVMRMHPVYAHEMLSPVDYLRRALDIPYCHHEKWDGTGYPRGLSGEDIPRTARIFAVVDVWDALLSDRPYRPAWTEEEARGHIMAESGSHFDPEAVEAFLCLLDDSKASDEGYTRSSQ